MSESNDFQRESEELVGNSEIVQTSSVKNSFNSIQDFVRGQISNLREKDMSYKEIGELLEMNKGQVQMLEKGTWYPKKKVVEDRIFSKLTRSPINSNVEEKSENRSERS